MRNEHVGREMRKKDNEHCTIIKEDLRRGRKRGEVLCENFQE